MIKINKNKPSKADFTQWLNTQPDTISYQEIADYYMVTSKVISTWLRSWNINLKSLGKGRKANNNKPSKADFIQWLNTQSDMISRQEIADHYMTAAHVISNWLKSWDISLTLLGKGKFANPNKPSKEDFVQWLNTQPDNVSRQEIADHYMVAAHVIGSWLISWNISLTLLGKGKLANPNRPSKEDFIQWLNTQPDNVSIKEIADHYMVEDKVINSWLISWNINLKLMGKGKFANPNKPSKEDFIRWINTQPDNISHQTIADHYMVPAQKIRKWLTSWDITLALLGKGKFANDKSFSYNKYCLDLTKSYISHTNNILTQADFDYKHMIILIKDGLDSQIYVCTQNEQEFIKTPVELIDEYIERNVKSA